MNVALLLVLFILSLCCTVAQGRNLYPSCQGDERQGFAGAGGETTIFALPQKTRALTLVCLAYEVSSLMGGMKKGEKDPCYVPHQTEYLHRIVVRAATEDEATRKVNVTDFDVKDLAGGSLGNVVIRLLGMSKVSLVFMNDATNHQCSLRIRAIISFAEQAEPTQQERLPVAVSVVPRTVYVKRSAMTTVLLRYPWGTNMHEAQSDVVKLVALSKECGTGYFDGHAMRIPSSFPPVNHLGDPATLGARDYYFDTPETYRVCYYGKGNQTGSEIAVIRVFDGNPTYYQMVSGQDEQGRVFVGAEATVKFYGYDLDTRPGGDSAKFVTDAEDCATAKPAGGVAESTDLGPGDSYGPGTTYTLWTWVLRKAGAFKLCYKRRNGVWTEVPSIADVDPEVASTSTSGATEPKHIPRPTDPVTKAECPMASTTPEAPWISYKSLKFTFNGTRLPKDLLKTLSQRFCIPRAALAVTHVTHDPDGRQVMYLSILCEDLGEAASCDTVERQNYILSLGQQKLTPLVGLGIASVEGSRHLFAFGDDVVVLKKYGGHILVLLITCLTVVVVVAMAVYGVLKYRESRQYFIQFGADDAEVEDMYATDGPDDLGYRRPRGVKDAVIEVEE
ncbi:putative Golgi/lysosome glycoprotein [Trypanosoma rangeli]|uniref:Putative Golgi/lysosome glycoprotein n=1 Tax=Trypanosoma rangeli TaxID=5698 RepID=A0A3R7KSB6_TRYRA|nr:putative Golgi/lysosome glycoprotein [Trypanosoma rangeli]RNF08694.1 putative Golgi/lysosome glycoprotein [Trypanosoma rangeli]|eukprot:RNF08694.1 putative Golgi/lysosome glycoprotein [Trypanosoma rangeli]